MATMDRATRIANLYKLQLPGTVGQSQQRKTRHSIKTKGISTISHHFSINENASLGPELQQEVSTSTHPTAVDDDVIETANKCTPPKVKANRAKRTRLDEFIFKTPQATLTESKTLPKPNNEDDFDLPEKKTKKAPPKTNKSNTNPSPKVKKPSKKKNQPKIKTAFLRNEQLFAEIAAQHCAADNFDGDDIQLAIAISKSEAESNGIVDVVGDNDVVVDGAAESLNDEQKAEKIRRKLEKYGFRTAEHQDYNTFAAAFMPQPRARRLKSKWANKFTALTLRDQQLQNKKLQQKIEAILNQQFRTRPLTTKEQEFSEVSLQSSLLRKCAKDIKTQLLNLSENPQTENEKYFVAELFEISKLAPGHLLKDWNAIQGRDLTPRKTCHKNEMEEKLQKIYAELEEYFRSLKERGLNESILAKEQTFGEVKEIKENPEENKKQFRNIANDMVCSKKQRKSNIFSIADDNMLRIPPLNLVCNDKETDLGDSSEASLMSTDTSQSNTVFKLLPPINDLDLMQVSGTSTNVEQTELQSQKPNIDQLKVACDLLREEVALMPLKYLDPCEDGNISSHTEAPNSEQVYTVATNLTDISSYALGIENAINVNKKECKTFAIQNVDLLQEQRNKITSTALQFLPEVETSYLNGLQISSTSVNGLTANTTQKNRSKSPDLFADSESDAEMEGVNNNSEQSKLAVNVKEKRSSASFECSEGVTTYEIYSSDEVKNLSSLANLNFKKSNVIELMQECKRETKQNGLNQSKSIVEIELFADSPLQDEDEEEDSAVFKVINNSQDPKNLKSKNDESFKCTLSPYEVKAKSQFKDKKFSLGEEFVDTHKTEANDDTDVVLHDIEMNQMTTSFFNFQGSKQLETCFHRETAVEDFKFASKETPVMKTKPEKIHQGNDTVFRDLCNKYLGKSSMELKSKTNEYDLKTSFTQVQPRIVTPKSAHNGSQFTMDLNVTPDCNINIRKTLSFESKTPEKFRDLVNFQLSKSRSFNEPNICIDLTQNDDVVDLTAEEEDDEYLVLSDDEINYSIWNSNKTGCRNKIQHESDNEDYEELNIKNYKKPKKSLSSPLEGVSTTGCLNEIQHESDNGDYEELNIKSYKKPKKSLSFPFEGVSPPKRVFHNSISSEYKTNSSQLDRSRFGILEEFSEPIDFASTAALEHFSFLDSPTETSAPMKRFSTGPKTQHQLNTLVSNLDVKKSKSDVIDDFEDYVFNTELNQSNTTTNTTLPQGLDQLMTAEISFEHATSRHPSTNKKKRFSLDSDNMEEINDNLHDTAANRNSELSYKSECEKYEITIKDRTYAIRNINVPKSDYTLKTEEELMKELYEYGIRPLKRKQAIKILEYIYTQTHPLIVDDTIANDKPNQYSNNFNDFDVASTSKASSSSSCVIPFSSQDSIRLSQNYSVTQKNSIKPSKENPQNSKKLNLQDASGMEMLRNSMDFHAELVEGEHYILQTNVTKKTPQPLMPLHIAWFNLICCNPNLLETILMYEPIDLQEIYLFLKQLGYRYDPKDLKQFFDNRCIIFRYDLAAAGGNSKAIANNRHVRRKKHKI